MSKQSSRPSPEDSFLENSLFENSRSQQIIKNVSATDGSTAVAIFTNGPVNLPHATHPQVQSGTQNFSPSVIRHKIFLTDPEVDRERVVTKKGKRTPGTCVWIKEHALYKNWLASGSDQRLLWVSGGPGMGKTMLSAFISYDLEQSFASSGGEVLYYFCSHDDEHDKSAAAILRGLIFQVLQRREDLTPVVTRHLPEEASAHQTQQVVSSFETLWIIFRALVARFDIAERLICLIDGLDEYDYKTTRPLMDRLRRPESLGFNVRILIVSRDVPGLRGLPRLKLDPDNQARVQSDVGRFIAHEVDQLAVTHDLESHFCGMIKAELLDRSEGTFLWVGFAMQELNRQSTASQIQRAIASLPLGLDSIYSRILMKIREEDKEKTALLLQCVALAFRPFTVPELAALTGSEATLGVSAERAMLDTIALCADLLTCNDDEVTFVHLSVKEYLQTKLPIHMKDQPGLRTFYVDAEDAQLNLTKTCIEVIEDSGFGDEYANERTSENSDGHSDTAEDWSIAPRNSDEDVEVDEHAYLYDQSPLLKYATLYWVHHATYLSFKAPRLFDLGKPFFTESSVTRANWLRAYVHYPGYKGRSLSLDSTILVVAARFNLLALVSILLEDPRKTFAGRWMINISRLFDATQRAIVNEALCVACAEGHENVARALLRNGADANGYGYTKSTPMSAATSTGKGAIVQLLVDNGLDTTQKEYLAYRESVFRRAASRGDEQVVRGFLGLATDRVNGRQLPGPSPAPGRHTPSGLRLQTSDVIDIESRSASGRRALHLAAFSEHPSIVQLLLENGADINATNDYGDTALHDAISSDCRSSIRVLLLRHPDCNVLSKHDGTPLHLAIRSRSCDIVESLLNVGARLDLQDRQGRTPLAVAASLGLENEVALLVDRGASADATDEAGRTAMSLATVRGHGHIVKAFLERGVNPDLKDSDESTALHVAAEMGSADIVKLLIDGGAFINAQCDGGATALANASFCSRTSVVKLLLDHGADASIPDSAGWTALMWALSDNDEGILQLLARHGATVTEEQRQRVEYHHKHRDKLLYPGKT